MKRIIRVLTAVLLSAAMALSVSAAADKEPAKDKDNKKNKEAITTAADTSMATLSFDTDKAIRDGILQTFGAVEGFGMKLTISGDVPDIKNRCLAVTFDSQGKVAEDLRNVGFYIDSRDFGLDSFEGCEISARVYAQKCGADKLQFFTDGQQVSYDVSVAMTSAPRWERIKITPPEGAENTLFGVMITSSVPISDTVCYIDEIVIKNSKGERVKNIGDYQSANAVKKSMAGAAILTVVLILLVAGVCAIFIMKNINKYR